MHLAGRCPPWSSVADLIRDLVGTTAVAAASMVRTALVTPAAASMATAASMAPVAAAVVEVLWLYATFGRRRLLGLCARINRNEHVHAKLEAV